MSSADKSIALGHPSYVWRFGQERRLNLIRAYVNLDRKRILDIGCGIGTYMRQFRRFSDEVYGVDIDRDKLRQNSDRLLNLSVARSENLPFGDNVFDVTLLHEVIEHVNDEGKTIGEAYRVTKSGGNIVIYAPNRLYPFETHGFYLGKRYIFKLLPFVNYLPNALRRLFVPHARAYLTGDIRRLFNGLGISMVVHGYVYPGFDKIAAKNHLLAALLRRFLYFFEKTPLRIFGLSHFVILEKVPRGS